MYRMDDREGSEGRVACENWKEFTMMKIGHGLQRNRRVSHRVVISRNHIEEGKLAFSLNSLFLIGTKRVMKGSVVIGNEK